jgi:hypothetical protein
MVCAKTEFAHANQGRVYDRILFTSTDSWIRPRRLESRTRLMHRVISSSESEVMACTRRDMGQAFSRPTSYFVRFLLGSGKKKGAGLTMWSADAMEAGPGEVVGVPVLGEDHFASILVDWVILIYEAKDR